MDQGKPRGSHRLRGEFEPVELGNEPPLSVDGGSNIVDRRRVSVQWFAGTILTGLCGAALMSGAVYASLDGETNFATLPEKIEVALRGAIGNVGERSGSTRKGDRLATPSESNAQRHVIRVSTTSRAGNREVVRVRPFVRITANLSLASSDYTASIPPFNAQKLLAESDSETPAPTAEAGAAPDAEVSFITRDLAQALPRMKVASLLPMDDVVARVRETASWGGTGAPQYALAGVPTGSARLAYAVEGDKPDPYAGFEARIVPENVTLLQKTAAQATGGNTWNEKTVVTKKGDNITSILRELGATPEEAKAVASTLGSRGRDNGLKDGLKIRVLLSPVNGGARQQPVRVIIANDTQVEAAVALSDMGRFVSVDVNSLNTEVADASEEDDDGTGVRLYQSIYETALRNQVPKQVIEGLIRIYSYDVDFQRRAQSGDSFDVIYAGEDETAGGENRSEVLYASLTVAGETKRYYRFQTPDDNIVDYYDESGKSAKKFLVRKPLGEAIMRSGFGVRHHPILGYTKMHTGVDWAAPYGTPIFASGNGTVEKVGWESGYGKYVRLAHSNGYQTAYGHMTAFARGIEPGVRVRQGQVIGYVGSTGLSTGAHVHYEILVNGRFVDPMRIRLPRGRALDGPILANFEQERDRVEGMMSRAPGRVAQTNTR